MAVMLTLLHKIYMFNWDKLVCNCPKCLSHDLSMDWYFVTITPPLIFLFSKPKSHISNNLGHKIVEK